MVELIVLLTWHPDIRMVIFYRIRQRIAGRRSGRRGALYVNTRKRYLYRLVSAEARWGSRAVIGTDGRVRRMPVCLSNRYLMR